MIRNSRWLVLPLLSTKMANSPIKSNQKAFFELIIWFQRDSQSFLIGKRLFFFSNKVRKPVSLNLSISKRPRRFSLYYPPDCFFFMKDIRVSEGIKKKYVLKQRNKMCLMSQIEFCFPNYTPAFFNFYQVRLLSSNLMKNNIRKFLLSLFWFD